jgi:hypothetical protein
MRTKGTHESQSQKPDKVKTRKSPSLLTSGVPSTANVAVVTLRWLPQGDAYPTNLSTTVRADR